ncbi:52 kDa repressor of the inhibitor of the protein kinase-like isoform X3 [Homarus americanus]|uniref:52 kDa repressor of the inhibitor of the protein kinase-like 2 n=1 Tax=Homarus americanus TaxID=6706 RepID=A0A8J5MRG2_HOMAM|nr:52 kDa repressor of the inhibitor of the protein kinase-like isoform X3 [Homarus americanus]KAG7160612.1 52 kDa repressor of the inhibitor of the protein kinase-like 2 [Homarus americanus]
MPSNCSVYGCNNTRKKTTGSSIKYFRFPKEKQFRQRWIYSCCRADDINADSAVVCSIHFKECDYKDDLKCRLLEIERPKRQRTLRDDAVPSLFLPQVTSTTGKSSVPAKRRRLKKPARYILRSSDYKEAESSSDVNSNPGTTLDADDPVAQPSSFTCSSAARPIGGPKKRKRQDACDNILSLIGERLQSSRQDEFDIIGKNVNNKLRRLSREQQLFAERLINDVLFEGGLANLNRNSKIAI